LSRLTFFLGCPFQAADALLKHQTILQLGDTIAGMNFFVIRERKNKRILATGAEKKAVRLACKVWDYIQINCY